jgi:hypothetical protein
MQIKPPYVTFEQAKWFKEIGFNEYCHAYFHTDKSIRTVSDGWLNEICVAPEQWQVVEWLRVNHGIWIYVIKDGGWWIPFIQDLSNEKEEGVRNIEMTNLPVCFNSPQEAYSAAFDYIKNSNLI